MMQRTIDAYTRDRLTARHIAVIVAELCGWRGL